MDLTTVTLLQLFSTLIPTGRKGASEVSSCPQEAQQSTGPVTSLTCSHTPMSKQLLLFRLHMKIPSSRSFRRQRSNQQLRFKWSLDKRCFLLDIHDSRNSFPISTNIAESCLFALPPPPAHFAWLCRPKPHFQVHTGTSWRRTGHLWLKAAQPDTS